MINQSHASVLDINGEEHEKLLKSKILIAKNIAENYTLADNVRKKLIAIGLKESNIENLNTIDDYFEKVNDYDIIIDCLQDIKSKFILNNLSIKYTKPLIYANLINTYAQITTIVPKKTPCLKCLFPELDFDSYKDFCTQEQPFAINQIADIEVKEAINLLLNKETGLKNNLLTFNANDMKFRNIKLSKNYHCKICSTI
jgi:conserved hypothetical membrane related protein